METNQISLIEVTKENWLEVCRLSRTLTPDQRKCVADNVVSFAEAHFNPNAWYRAIALDSVPIGFVMIDTDFVADAKEDNPCHFIWRFMIGSPWQGKGYGKEALDILCDQYRREGHHALYLSCHTEEYGPLGFYLKYGFVDTGFMEDEEEVLKLTLR
jgi:diamine N-acetyltransferase